MPIQPEVKYLRDYKVPEYLIDSIDLYISLDEEIACVKSTLQVKKNPYSTDQNRYLFLNGEDIRLKSLKLDGQILDQSRYRLDEEYLVIYQVPETFELTIVNTLHPDKNTSLEGLYKTEHMFCTQCEAEGFRKITYFPDRPDVMSLFKCTIEADIYKYPVILSNGNLVASGDLRNGRHWATWEDPFKKPAYLFAMVAGDLAVQNDTFTTMSGRTVDLKIYVEHENIDKCDHAMISLKKSMQWDEERFGREYDLDLYMIVATNDFNMGAMENKGLNIFNSKYVLAKPETATDTDYEGIEAVIAHEYFHNWTGNRVTLNSWFQLSLKEGLTVFRDQEFSSDMNSRAVQRINDVVNLRLRQFPEDAGPMAHPIRPESYIEMNNFYTMTVYEKGAEVIRMMYVILGSEGFRKGMDLYFERHDGEAVTTEDFIKAMEDASNTKLEQFRLWYSQAGTPEVSVETSYDADQKEYQLSFKQLVPDTPGQLNKQPMHIPIKFALLDKNGQELPHSHGDVLHLRANEDVFIFENMEEKPVPSLLREFSAPVKLSMDLSEDELIFLALNDPEPFNRWESGQRIFLNILMEMVTQLQADKEPIVPQHGIDIFISLLTDTTADPALISQAITLPSESDIWDRMDMVDPDAAFQSIRSISVALARAAEPLLMEIYHKNQSDKYSMDSVEVARRKLKNKALHYLGQLSDVHSEIIVAQFNTADNMTDRMASLSLLVDMEGDEKERALQLFYDDWHKDALVMDKWFSIQALSKQSDTLAQVKKLLDHPLFSMQNPNKVRSLIGSFCIGNRVHFHQKDGAGYRFLTEAVLLLNDINPQIAARMVSGFNQWRRFDHDRQSLMKAELEKIKGISKLSRDVYEIVNKALG